ncbi:MAG TPA: fused MFS/spermidine synthase [Bryobacteraceae bacterium]|nr:fused MFS/spermidine synthase [Bryobacteraceae bacterium]
MRGLYLLFFLSGFPALLYQIVWQRALFTIFGVNVESVTVVVSAFMLGLGLGSLLGGRLSKKENAPLLALFGLTELGIAAFGAVSLPLFHWVAQTMAGAPAGQTFFAAFALVLLPTVGMGATLPLLTTQLVRMSGEVGRSVGMLYFVNTLGSAAACFVAALFLLRDLGMQGTVWAAAGINALIGIGVLALHFRAGRKTTTPTPREEAQGQGALPFPAAAAMAFATGFVSLGYEIVWYRVYSFVTGGSPRCFSYVLGSFLAGIAFGSLGSRRLARRPDIVGAMAVLVVLANAVGFLTAPAVGWAVAEFDYTWTLPLVALSAGLLGATFPLLCQAAVNRESAGAGLSYLYLSNIAGSTLGSYVMGFVLMDVLSLRAVSVALLLAGSGVAAALGRRRAAVLAAVVCAGGVLLSGPLFHMIYERLLYEDEFDAAAPFTDIVETHSGVVTVDAERHIFGGGAHDGILTTSLYSDSCIRPFSLSYLHPAPKEVLLVGMAGGAWSQIVGNHPLVERAVVVEINPGYRTVIGRYSEVAPVLRNPKVEIVIDDGRRWMSAHRERKFDAILMDTVQHWRSNATNLLSVEMMTLARSMLKPGGILYYNTTYSDDAQKTGAAVFPHALRFGPFLAVSDSPLALDEARWRTMLETYSLDGQRVAAPSDPRAAARLDELARYFRIVDRTGNEHLAVEPGASVRKRTAGARMITDDNMATEWTR